MDEAQHMVVPDGVFVHLKGPSVDDEVDEWLAACERYRFEPLPAVEVVLSDGSERLLVAARRISG